VAVLRTLLVIAAFLGAAVLPCLLALALIKADEVVELTWRALRRGVRKGRRRLGLALGRSRLARRYRLLRLARAVRLTPAEEASRPTCPPIERIAADLRRLGRQRTGIAMRSPVWFTAVQRAYDDRLRVASGQLGIEQHLDELTGIDLELERVRVEELLCSAGLAMRDDKPEWRR
jgi:hypothetical protein